VSKKWLPGLQNSLKVVRMSVASVQEGVQKKTLVSLYNKRRMREQKDERTEGISWRSV